MKELDRLYLDHVAALQAAYAHAFDGPANDGFDGVAIHSGSLVPRSEFDDQFWPLRPVPHWQHWLPLVEPDAVLLIQPGRRPCLVRRGASSFWEKPAPPESDAFLQAFEVLEDRTGSILPDLLETGAWKGAWKGKWALIGEARAFAKAPWKAVLNPPQWVAALDALRVRKTPYEVACLAEANRRARAGHEALRDAFFAGDFSELDLHLLYLRATAQDDAETPYKNIVAMGPHAATLHHIAYGKRADPREAESLLVDAGATCRGYGADVTRTWVKGRGAAAEAFAAFASELNRLQQRLCADVAIGKPYESLHDASHREVAALLREGGVLRGSVDEAVARGVTRAFYPHGVGHSLGLQTHDVGCALRPPRHDNPFLRNTSGIALGQVFTIEPGIYFIEELLEPLRRGPWGGLVDWKTVATLAPLGGVRIEDDLYVDRPQGARNLTREAIPEGTARGP
jgi:Xaa-Pro dipeptidase